MWGIFRVASPNSGPMGRRNDDQPPIQRQRVGYLLPGPHTNEFVTALEHADEDIFVGFTVKRYFVVVEVFLQITTRSSDGNVRMPKLDAVNKGRNFRARLVMPNATS